MTLYNIDEDTQIDEFGVDHSNFSLRDKLEYNFMRAKEKEMKQDSPWYRKTYDKVYNEANKLHDAPLSDKYKHSVVSCIGAQDGLYGSAVTGAMGIAKEIADIYRKFPEKLSGRKNYGGYLSILKDSAKDLMADARGIYNGYINQDGDCYDIMKSFYDPRKGF